VVILHLITTIERGGAEKQLLVLTNQQRMMGHEVHVVPIKGKLDLQEEFQAQGCLVHTQLLAIKPVSQKFAIQKIVKQVCPDVIHAHLPRAELLASVIKTNSIKIVSKHNTELFFPTGNPIVSKLLSQFVSYRVDAIIAISSAVKKFIIDSGELPKHSKLHVVLYGMGATEPPNREIIENLKKELKIPKGARVFGTISRLVPQKDLKTQLLAFNEYLKINQAAQLVVIGEGPLLYDLKTFSEEIGCQDNVIWYGKTSNINEMLQIFDIFLLSSLYEGLGLVLLEAIGNQSPILAANNSAIPEVLGYEFPGLFETSDWEALFNKMRQADSAEFCKILLGQQEKRKKYFNPEVMARNIQDVYEGVHK
jgi:glycosyltransferase involved in cell wall biosynthesis